MRMTRHSGIEVRCSLRHCCVCVSLIAGIFTIDFFVVREESWSFLRVTQHVLYSSKGSILYINQV